MQILTHSRKYRHRNEVYSLSSFVIINYFSWTDTGRPIEKVTISNSAMDRWRSKFPRFSPINDLNRFLILILITSV